MPNDIYFGSENVVTTRDRLNHDPSPLFPAPRLPSQRRPRQAVITYEPQQVPPPLPSQLSTSAPALLEERRPNSHRRHEVPPQHRIQSQPAQNRYEIPPLPIVPQYQPVSRLVLPPPNDEPVVAQQQQYYTPPAPEPPPPQQYHPHSRHASQPAAGTAPMPVPQGLRVETQHGASKHRRVPSSASSLSPSAAGSPFSGRSGGSRSDRSDEERISRRSRRTHHTPDSSRSRGSPRGKGQKQIGDPRNGPKSWQSVVKEADGTRRTRYHYG